MRHLNLFVILTVMYFSWNAFAQVGTVQDKCGFYKTEVAKKLVVITHVIVADRNCSLTNPQDRPLYVKWGDANMSERKSLYSKAEAFFAGKQGSSCMKNMDANLAYSAWNTDVMGAQSLFASASSENRAAFCAQAVQYMNQRLQSGKTVVSATSEEKPIQLASASPKPQVQREEKQVKREETVAVAMSTSSSYQSSARISGPSSLAYTNAYSNLLPTGYQQPMFIQTMVNQIVFIPGVGYRPVMQPVIVPVRPGVQ